MEDTEQNLYRKEVGQDVHEACISLVSLLGMKKAGMGFLLDIAEDSEGIVDKKEEETILQCEEVGFVGGGNIREGERGICWKWKDYCLKGSRWREN